MHRSTDNDQHSTHAFVDITTGQFVFKGQAKTTAKVQVVPRRNPSDIPDDTELRIQSGSNWEPFNSPSDDAP